MTGGTKRTAYVAEHVVVRPPEPARQHAAVLVEGGRIVDVVDRDNVPAEYSVVDLGDQWLLPGLVDLHVHLVWSGGVEPSDELRAQRPATTALLASQRGLQHLMRGVTTVRDVAGEGAVVFAVRDEIASGRMLGPQVIASGRPVVMTGGHGWEMAVIADGPDEVRRAVRTSIHDGAEVIKVMATGGVFPPGEYQDSVQYGLDELTAAVTAAHDSGTEGGLPPHPVAKGTEVFANGMRAVRHAIAANLRIAAGTDAGGRAKPHGCLAWELELLAEAGLPGAEAVAAATTYAAEACGRTDFGTLAPDARADLVSVAADPYTVTPLRTVSTVVAAGQLVRHRGEIVGLEQPLPALGPLPARTDARTPSTLAR